MVASIIINPSNRSIKCKEGKEHLWNDVVMYSASGLRIDWKTYRQWAHLPSYVRQKLVQEYHEEIDDPLTMVSSACLHCGISYTEWDNPYKSEI